MNDEKSFLQKKRRKKNINDEFEKIKKNYKNKKEKKDNSNYLIEDTYEFLERIKKKLVEINNIRSNRIEGVLVSSSNKYIKYNNHNITDIPEVLSDESDFCIIDDVNSNLKKLENNENFKIDKFNDIIECLICFKKINKYFDIDCNHKFCNRCGIKWIKIKRNCPVCRKSL